MPDTRFTDGWAGGLEYDGILLDGKYSCLGIRTQLTCLLG